MSARSLNGTKARAFSIFLGESGGFGRVGWKGKKVGGRELEGGENVYACIGRRGE